MNVYCFGVYCIYKKLFLLAGLTEKGDFIEVEGKRILWWTFSSTWDPFDGTVGGVTLGPELPA